MKKKINCIYSELLRLLLVFFEMGDTKLLWQGVDSFLNLSVLHLCRKTFAIFCSQNFSKPTITGESFGCGFSPLAAFDFYKGLYIPKNI